MNALKWLAACLAAVASVAQAQPADAYPAEHIAAITRMVASLPVYRTLAGGQDFAQGMAHVYARHISKSQAEEITAFARSEAGRKYLAADFADEKGKATAQYSAEESALTDRFRQSQAAAALDRVYRDAEWGRALAHAARRIVEEGMARLDPIVADLRARGAEIEAAHAREALAVQSDEFKIPEVLRTPESIRAGRERVVQLEVAQAKRRRELWAYHDEWLAEMRRHVEAGVVPEAIIAFNQDKIRGIQERLEREFAHERRKFAIYREFLAFAESRQGKYEIDIDGQIVLVDDADIEAFTAIATKWNREIDAL